MAANKTKGIRAGLSHDHYTAVYSKEVMNCNVIALGERVTGPEMAK